MSTALDGAAIDKVLQDAVASGAVPHVAAIAADRDGNIYEGAAGVRIAGVSEEPVSKGIRRITALTGSAGRDALDIASKVNAALDRAKTAPDDQLELLIAELGQDRVRTAPLVQRRRAEAAVAELQERHRAWQKSQRVPSQIDVASVATNLLERADAIGHGKLIVGDVPGASDEQLRTTMDSLKKRAGSYGILLASADDGKVTFVAAVSDDLIAKGLKAGDWVREAAKITGGGGGGKPQMAQAGGKDPSKLPDALDVARRFARERVG